MYSYVRVARPLERIYSKPKPISRVSKFKNQCIVLDHDSIISDFSTGWGKSSEC